MIGIRSKKQFGSRLDINSFIFLQVWCDFQSRVDNIYLPSFSVWISWFSSNRLKISFNKIGEIGDFHIEVKGKFILTALLMGHKSRDELAQKPIIVKPWCFLVGIQENSSLYIFEFLV